MMLDICSISLQPFKWEIGVYGRIVCISDFNFSANKVPQRESNTDPALPMWDMQG